MSGMIPSHELDRDLSAKMRAMGLKWTVNPEDTVLKVAVPAGIATRKVIAMVNAFYQTAAVLKWDKTSATIQL